MLNYAYTLRLIISKTVKSLKQISEAEFSGKSFPKKWSKKEILGHLIDSAVNNLSRFTTATLNEPYIFERYDQDRWVEINGYNNRPATALIDLWENLNLHLAAFIDRIPEEQLKKRTREHNFDEICMLMVEKNSESCLSYLIWDYLYHMEHHLAQIISTYEYELTNFEDE